MNEHIIPDSLKPENEAIHHTKTEDRKGKSEAIE
jgi:hypothetical protein